jgi:hypothetical protein
MQLALYLNVLSTITVKPLPPIGVFEPMHIRGILALPRAPRFRHLMHQPFTSNVFAIFELERIGRGTQPCRQPKRQAHRLRAAVALKRNERPADAGCSRRRSMLVSK